MKKNILIPALLMCQSVCATQTISITAPTNSTATTTQQTATVSTNSTTTTPAALPSSTAETSLTKIAPISNTSTNTTPVPIAPVVTQQPAIVTLPTPPVSTSKLDLTHLEPKAEDKHEEPKVEDKHEEPKIEPILPPALKTDEPKKDESIPKDNESKASDAKSSSKVDDKFKSESLKTPKDPIGNLKKESELKMTLLIINNSKTSATIKLKPESGEESSFEISKLSCEKHDICEKQKYSVSAKNTDSESNNFEFVSSNGYEVFIIENLENSKLNLSHQYICNGNKNIIIQNETEINQLDVVISKKPSNSIFEKILSAIGLSKTETISYHLPSKECSIFSVPLEFESEDFEIKLRTKNEDSSESKTINYSKENQLLITKISKSSDGKIDFDSKLSL